MSAPGGYRTGRWADLTKQMRANRNSGSPEGYTVDSSQNGLLQCSKLYSETSFTTSGAHVAYYQATYGVARSFRWGLYLAGSNGLPTGAPLWQSVEVTTSSGGTAGSYTYTFPQVTMPAGVVWLAMAVTPYAAPYTFTVQAGRAFASDEMGFNPATLAAYHGWTTPWTYASPPTSLPTLTGATFTPGGAAGQLLWSVGGLA